MKFWSRLATWKKLILVFVLLIVLAAAGIVALILGFWLYPLLSHAWGVCIPQGTRTILFTTTTSTRAIRPGADGQLQEVSLRLIGQEGFFTRVLPQGCIPDSGGWIPLFDWVREPVPRKATVKPPCDEWTNVLRLDLQTLVARPTLRAEGRISPPEVLNCLDSRFAAFRFDYCSFDPSRPRVAAIFDVADATFSTIQDPIKEYRGLVLLGEHDYVGVGDDLQPVNPHVVRIDDKPGYLSRRGERVADSVYYVFGATPDLKRVFFEKYEAVASGATISALWTYSPNDGTTQRLMEWGGDCLRVTSDSQRFGFLETKRTVMPDGQLILGAYIFDLNGRRIEDFHFKQPIRPRGSYDWSPDWGVIAYSDKTDLIIQSLDGKILGRFRLLRWSDVVQFYRSVRRHN